MSICSDGITNNKAKYYLGGTPNYHKSNACTTGQTVGTA